MSNELIMLVVAGIVAGCSAQSKPEPKTVPRAVVEMGGKWVVALGTTKLGPKHLAPPDATDRVYAAQLPQEVTQRCIAFLDKGGSIKPTLLAARQIGSYIIVAFQYKGGPSASDRFVVYSIQDEQVVGECVWYVQY